MAPNGAPALADKVGSYSDKLKGESLSFENSIEENFQLINAAGNLHDCFLPEGFIETTDKDPALVYADTDSAYINFILPFDKNENIDRTVTYLQDIAFRLNDMYMNALNFYMGQIGGWHPDFNTMDFKSEVIAFRGFFGAKKFYALGKIWDEGEYFDTLKIKITGGQLKKADVTQCTKEMLTEIYELLTQKQEISDEVVLYKTIFTQIRNKYILKLKEAINNLEFSYFSIPKKWSFGEKKTVPSSITGAKLYNRIIKDTFNVGDAVLEYPIKFPINKLRQEVEKNPNINENMLATSEITEKVKKISLPPLMTEKDKVLIISRFNELEIVPDFDNIIDFNIDMKLEPYKVLFGIEVARKAQN